MIEDKKQQFNKACTGCHSELTLAEYQHLMRQIEQEEMAKLATQLNNTKITTSVNEEQDDNNN